MVIWSNTIKEKVNGKCALEVGMPEQKTTRLHKTVKLCEKIFWQMLPEGAEMRTAI